MVIHFNLTLTLTLTSVKLTLVNAYLVNANLQTQMNANLVIVKLVRPTVLNPVAFLIHSDLRPAKKYSPFWSYAHGYLH